MTEKRVTVDRDGPLLLIGLNRPEKRNAADVAMLEQLALAYGELERDDEARVGVVYAHGDHFTGGLDLADVAPRIGPEGLAMVPEGGIHPWGMDGSRVSKPVVLAVQGTCLTLGVELALASDITIAASDTVFAQLEVARAILPFGGATTRFAATAGWGDAMRWMLTGDRFDAAEAHRMGLVQEVAVQATLANARLAVREGAAAAEARLPHELVRLAQSEDARIGMQAFLTRTEPTFVGR